MHIHNYNECIIITDIRNFMHSYHGLKQVLKLITSLCLFRTPIGVTEPMLIQRYINTYWYLYLSQISRRILQNLYLYHGVYTCSGVPVGITEITERILDLWNLILYESTRKYYLIIGLF